MPARRQKVVGVVMVRVVLYLGGGGGGRVPLLWGIFLSSAAPRGGVRCISSKSSK